MLSSESDGSIKAQLCTSSVVRGKLVLPLSRHLIGQPQSDTESLAIAPQVSSLPPLLLRTVSLCRHSTA